jgi:hypothetical protein
MAPASIENVRMREPPALEGNPPSPFRLRRGKPAFALRATARRAREPAFALRATARQALAPTQPNRRILRPIIY